MNAPMESLIYSRIPYCSLCGEKFNSTIRFRSVVFVNQHQGPILTESLNFQWRNSAIVLPKLNIQILDSNNNCRTSMLALSIHNLCWTAIDRPPSIRFVYNLGIAMNPLLWEKLPQSIYSHYRIASTSIHAGYPLDNCHRTTLNKTPASATVQLCGDIFLYLTSTLDGTYISGICIGDRLYGYRSNWSLRRAISSPVAAIAFTLGLYRLRQIDFLSKAIASITKSSKAKSQEVLGVIYPQSAQSPWIELEWDVMKISHFKWVPEHGNEQDFGHDFLWSSFYNWPRSCDFTSRNQRFMAYIPLHRGWVLFAWTCCLLFQQRLRRLGNTFQRLLRYQSYSVLITTNKGRRLTLGPYILPVEIQFKTLFSGSDGDVSGLYYDISPGLSTFTSLGVICRPGVSSLTPAHHDMMPCMPYNFDHLDLLDASPWSSFVSRAPLTNAKRLEVCYLGPRFTGMLLIYNDDGGISTLGQWYENTSLQADIFELDYRPDHDLRFSLVQTGRCQYNIPCWTKLKT
ncbi:uncharacterized protein BDW43DRAFT_323395 [Aspergillus alliaceus]|uniref:uncharacterized protein n=1 Tax=Petromyces alliaceus TaxID=209559 RepID=UPI0012A73B01|nr:uncharacterized protein BDW43DRAFT_323395 [Aspergillus alliaceus]KAB8227932.1 hypothetical protein BDW43DRAFT_323395 [Aspergillus alliaceus]